MTRGIPKKGDVLFTTEAPAGQCGAARYGREGGVRPANNHHAAGKEPTREHFPKSICFFLDPVQLRIRAKGTGATVQGIKARLLKLIEISFPKTLAEQERIVEKLDALER